MIELDPNMPGVAEASSQLDAMIAAESGSAEAQAPAPSANDGQRAAQPAAVEEAATVPKQAEGKPSAISSQPSAEAKPSVTSSQPSAAEADSRQPKAESQQPKAENSKYERDAARLPKSWKEFNAEKERIRAEHTAWEGRLQARAEELERKEREFAQASQQHPPEHYEAWAGQQLRRVKALEAEAEKQEAAGNYDGAQAARREAVAAQQWADTAFAQAESLRKTPPDARRQAAQAAEQAQRREWTLKAATEFADLNKADSAVARRTAELMNAEPRLRAEPAGIYWAARLAAAETVAGRATELHEALTKAQKRIADLELASNPSGAASTPKVAQPGEFGSLSEAEQLAALEHEAKDMRFL